MGRAVPYRRKRRRAPPRRRGGLGRLLVGIRPFALLGILLAAWPALDPALVEPLGPLASDPERVTARFTLCGRGRGHACVVDGDTFKLGQRKIRIIGIDAPEVKGACLAERQLAEKATARLQSLLNQGPFVMTGRIGDLQDRYGRDLRALNRERPDGSSQSIAEEMRASGLAHRYLGTKTSWC
jgi:endonuclease YncB( thermonuclease family)